MTDRETLANFRLKQAEETLADARMMSKVGTNPASTVNRAYYCMFYAVLALFIKNEVPVRTSRHAGIIGLFDSLFVHSGKFDQNFLQCETIGVAVKSRMRGGLRWGTGFSNHLGSSVSSLFFHFSIHRPPVLCRAEVRRRISFPRPH